MAVAEPLVLRVRLQTRLGMPSIGELWRGSSVVGYVSCTTGGGLVVSVTPEFKVSAPRQSRRALAIAIEPDEGTPVDDAP